MKRNCSRLILFLHIVFMTLYSSADTTSYTYQPGHESLKAWILPKTPLYPMDNIPTPSRVKLGKMLFFDKRLSESGEMSCATCHNPNLGWSDGLPTAKGNDGKPLPRSTLSIINVAYNNIFMWDGFHRSLIDQALMPITSKSEMNKSLEDIVTWLLSIEGYQSAFQKSYPQEGITEFTIAKALAAFEYTIISRNTPFDQWIQGNALAMTEEQIRGFKVFAKEDKGNCAACHMPPNFTDDGFHNLGIEGVKDNNKPDRGRFELIPLKSLDGAFKTPTLREITHTAPYFRTGSAKTLMDVVNYYNDLDTDQPHLSKNLTNLSLTEQDKDDLVAFMQALSTTLPTIVPPELPKENFDI